MAFSSILYSPIQFTVPKPHSHLHRSRPLSVAAAIPPVSTTADVAAVSEALDSTTIAVIGGGSVAALAAVLSLTDPEKRRQMQAEEVGGASYLPRHWGDRVSEKERESEYGCHRRDRQLHHHHLLPFLSPKTASVPETLSVIPTVSPLLQNHCASNLLTVGADETTFCFIA